MLYASLYRYVLDAVQIPQNRGNSNTAEFQCRPSDKNLHQFSSNSHLIHVRANLDRNYREFSVPISNRLPIISHLFPCDTSRLATHLPKEHHCELIENNGGTGNDLIFMTGNFNMHFYNRSFGMTPLHVVGLFAMHPCGSYIWTGIFARTTLFTYACNFETSVTHTQDRRCDFFCPYVR